MEKRVIDMTVEELISIVNEAVNQRLRIETKGEEFVYGLQGIMDLFNVSKPTAQKYKNTFLRPAVIQNGRTLMVNKSEAIRLFANQKN